MYICKKKTYQNMTRTTFGQRLRTLRLMNHLSMDQLGMRLPNKAHRQTIAKYECDVMKPRKHTLQAICKVLYIDPFFMDSGRDFYLSSPRHRNPNNSTIPEDIMNQLLGETSTWLASYFYKEREAGLPAPKFINPLNDIIIKTRADVELAANTLRQKWHIGDGPIASLCRLVERKGIKMQNTPLPKDVLGMSLWAENCYPLILINFDERVTSTERLRFTVAHELGHLLLRFDDEVEFECKKPNEDPIEKLCEIFAACLLLPRQTFIEEIGSHRDFLTLKELIDLKEQYGVSIAALVHQAWDFRIISREHYDWWFDQQINNNKREFGWGHYPVPESLGREMRLTTIVDELNKTNKAVGV